MNSLTTIFQTAGGLGLFLLGMLVMVDNLRILGGNAMRSALMRFTRSPLSGAITGATSTAILQSSSATTVAAVGFVGAGLLSFPQALGIIFGANIGTTVKGWLVALLGLKLNIGIFMLPLVLIGVLLRLFGKGRLSSSGLCIAGFALIFVGISTMQQGMSGLEGSITPDIFPDDTVTGRLKLVAIGIGFTLVTQSSSAGVAMALTALFTGTINFEQAACLVIGMDVGTTVTAMMASIGTSVPSRRTGLSHVIYNILTAIGALILLTPYITLWELVSPGKITENAEIALVAFHTTFNTIGVIVALPFTHKFAQLIEQLIPDKVTSYTRNLDQKLLTEPQVALTAVHHVIKDEYLELLNTVSILLTNPHNISPAQLGELQSALNETHDYIDQIHLKNDNEPTWNELNAYIHALDHMQRLHERCEEEQDRAVNARESVQLENIFETLKSGLIIIKHHIEADEWSLAAEHSHEIATFITEHAEPLRDKIMSHTARGSIDIPMATDQLEAIRWLRRVSKHINRITGHLSSTRLSLTTPTSEN